MNLEEISKVITELPTLIMYLVPGYIILWIMGFLLSKDSKQDNHIIAKSIVLSYILITLYSLIIGKQRLVSSLPIKASILLLSVILGYLAGRIVLSERFSCFLKKIGITRSVHNNFFNEIIDLEHGTWVTVYMPKEQAIYIGGFVKWEGNPRNENYFIILSDYRQITYAGDEIVDYCGDSQRRVMLNTRDVGRMELFYHHDSKKLL